MSHPEAIQDKNWGGDDEAGLADDGIFWKPSVGLVYRPLPHVAIKLDGSYHRKNSRAKMFLTQSFALIFHSRLAIISWKKQLETDKCLSA